MCFLHACIRLLECDLKLGLKMIEHIEYVNVFALIIDKISRMFCDVFIAYIGSIMRPYHQVEQAPPPPAVQGEMELAAWEVLRLRSLTKKGVLNCLTRFN